MESCGARQQLQKVTHLLLILGPYGAVKYYSCVYICITLFHNLHLFFWTYNHFAEQMIPDPHTQNTSSC